MADELLSRSVTIQYGGTAIARLTGFSLEVNKETVDVTSFDSPNSWKEFLVDLKEWNISFDGIVVRDAVADSGDYEELLLAMINSDVAVAVALNDTDASTTISGQGFLTGMPLSGSLGDKQTYSGTIQGTGALTVV